MLRETLVRNLAAFQRSACAHDGLHAAAVSIVVTSADNLSDACILLTRRPKTMRRHSGQFALPGGRVDAGETSKQAALRELNEELGIAMSAQSVIGRLDDYPTRSGFCISPFVIWAAPGLGIQPAPDEVACVFKIPLDELDSPDIPYLEPQVDHEHPVLSAPLATIGDRVFAPTAAILYQFREVAMNGRATRVAHFDQPHFARQ
ncbi:MAG: NUDIX hydrolase [Hyphomicrobiaceae bacterium]